MNDRSRPRSEPFVVPVGRPFPAGHADGTRPAQVDQAPTPGSTGLRTDAPGPARADAAAAYATAASSDADVTDTDAGEGADVAVDPQEHERQVVQDLDELAAKAEKADEYLVLAQRTKADFENYRKRAAREAALAQERGVAKLAKELLPAIDNLDRAVQAAEAFGPPRSGDGGSEPSGESGSEAGGSGSSDTGSSDAQLVSGIKLVHADVLAALARVGIEPFSPLGEPFDPQRHEAVAQHPREGTAPGTVIEVYQQGYRLGETVLRPARVLVAA